jgi:hypothetical protein|mmetsp:Transcript_18514/g.32107  ORF Transcript_18514/g.32107 Transcript_18514/m.32107 type:complete len:201 (+) Transcript_18514:360-962(+)
MNIQCTVQIIPCIGSGTWPGAAWGLGIANQCSAPGKMEKRGRGGGGGQCLGTLHVQRPASKPRQRAEQSAHSFRPRTHGKEKGRQGVRQAPSLLRLVPHPCGYSAMTGKSGSASDWTHKAPSMAPAQMAFTTATQPRDIPQNEPQGSNGPNPKHNAIPHPKRNGNPNLRPDPIPGMKAIRAKPHSMTDSICSCHDAKCAR